MKEGGIKKEIYVSVIASVLVMILFEPFLKFLWNWILLISVGAFQGLLNAIYRNAALGHRNHVEVQTFMFLSSVFLGIMLAIVLIQITDRAKIRSAISKIPSKVSSGFIVTFTVIAIFSLIFGVISNTIDLQLNASFQQRLTVLAPKITDQEYEEFEAKWASMKNRDDFLAIVQEMESTATSKGVELPPLLLK